MTATHRTLHLCSAPRRPLARRARAGFTLLEVMIGLALLGLGLTVLIKSAAGSIYNTQQAHMMGVVSDLARARMYEIEEILLKDGFSDTEQHEEDKTFEAEGWPGVRYSYKVEQVELPSWDQLQELTKRQAAKAGSGGGSGSGDDSAAEQNTFENSALGGMLSGFGGFGGGGDDKDGGDIGAAAGASFVQGQYTMFQQILKVSIRKVTLTVTWQVMGSDREMKVVSFFTDPGAMDKVINGLGAQDPDDKVSGIPGGDPGGGGGGGGGGGLPGGSPAFIPPNLPPGFDPNTPPPPGVGQ
jgi:prepilin-type N-terminal cleavage/methylation domain-containing protein